MVSVLKELGRKKNCSVLVHSLQISIPVPLNTSLWKTLEILYKNWTQLWNYQGASHLQNSLQMYLRKGSAGPRPCLPRPLSENMNHGGGFKLLAGVSELCVARAITVTGRKLTFLLFAYQRIFLVIVLPFQSQYSLKFRYLVNCCLLLYDVA